MPDQRPDHGPYRTADQEAIRQMEEREAEIAKVVNGIIEYLERKAAAMRPEPTDGDTVR